jgi:hypothetical protein
MTRRGWLRFAAGAKRRRLLALSALVTFLGGCSGRPPASNASTASPTTIREDLVFVTRDQCVNTPDMMINLDDALRALHLPLDYEVVNLAKLSPTDPRVGYPTPTLLYRNRDMFGMPEPKPPFPEPS